MCIAFAVLQALAARLRAMPSTYSRARWSIPQMVALKRGVEAEVGVGVSVGVWVWV
jgi:hypothetical protein